MSISKTSTLLSRRFTALCVMRKPSPKPVAISFDPFVTVDENTVGKLISSSVTDGRNSNTNIKIGVCGEHAGDPKSIQFFNSLDIDYISCSPYRIPTARLAAAQAQISIG